ncbi:unnamed protein product [Phyllotreta striolata]|uniref:Carboxylic ester hydrolase n=1 Tax=Phyllotreta striolata TaxID=444603 RepID=A0A9N9XMC6_PHYSR|nr:unnamed protein product [Phyllotreta striolata]
MVEDIVVSTSNGRIRGKTQKNFDGENYCAFYGIPYAKAPVGELRFKAPQPAEPWQEIWDGTKEGCESPSVFIPYKFQTGREDNCLHLNIYTQKLPRENEDIKRPVIVYIHGGSFYYGSNRSYIYGPEYLMTQDVVLVVLNFRLGVLGFLSLDDPSLEVPGNAGLKDQILALKWVQSNIHNFGGDANNVTIVGQSSGSASVHYLVLSPLCKGLFHKAIMQSGCALNYWANGKRNAKEIAKLMGYDENIDEKSLLEKLQQASVKSIIHAQTEMEDPFYASVIRPFGPVVEYPHEGALITEPPEVLMKTGNFNHIPIILGYTSKEGLMFEMLRKTRSDVSLPTNLERDIPFSLNVQKGSQEATDFAKELKNFYYKDKDITEEHIDNYYVLFGDTVFVEGIQKTASLIRSHQKSPVYLYRVNINSSLNLLTNWCQSTYHNLLLILTGSAYFLNFSMFNKLVSYLKMKLINKKVDGVTHGDEMFYLFKGMLSPGAEKGSEEELHIRRFVKLWTNFAKYGDPTQESVEILGDAKWPPLDESLENVFEIGNTLEVTKNVEKERVDFLHKLYNQYS